MPGEMQREYLNPYPRPAASFPGSIALKDSQSALAKTGLVAHPTPVPAV
jgi:hypothetical protein